MKKLCLIFLISTLLFSCNNETLNDSNNDAKADSVTVAPVLAPADTATSNIKPAPDSIKPSSIKFDDARRKKDSVSK